MGRGRVHPEVEYLRAVIARAIVASGDIALVVVGHKICGSLALIGRVYRAGKSPLTFLNDPFYLS